MYVVPLTLKDINAFVEQHHRHHKKVQGHKFSLGCMKNGTLVGAVSVGRPVARKTDQKFTAEVTRLVTDGSKNVCSFLYGAAARVAKEMGYHKIQTFILDSEPGTSLKASGWVFESKSKGGSWDSSNRPREDKHPLDVKQKWSKVLNPIPV